ncbi:hypothetical protein M9979_02765 [Sphingomonas sp. RP10(2022)]|uniref:Uncharacterized protein n=1 Tax=Sphingomonas liriopis TaxID=2949094 RepID=A0A9X2HP62_9SPHN|nr:hypothetical protein [Sphingomonas liriopis]MCP3733802.1 hypothetical protein [Sphingomonas liriopis]
MVSLIERENLYIFIFDVNDKDENADDIHRFIENSKIISAWWNYFPGVYFIQVNANEEIITNYFYERFPRISCFLMRVDRESFKGRMPIHAWSWLLNKSGNEEEEFVKMMTEFQANKKRLK